MSKRWIFTSVEKISKEQPLDWVRKRTITYFGRGFQRNYYFKVISRGNVFRDLIITMSTSNKKFLWRAKTFLIYVDVCARIDSNYVNKCMEPPGIGKNAYRHRHFHNFFSSLNLHVDYGPPFQEGNPRIDGERATQK